MDINIIKYILSPLIMDESSSPRTRSQVPSVYNTPWTALQNRIDVRERPAHGLTTRSSLSNPTPGLNDACSSSMPFLWMDTYSNLSWETNCWGDSPNFFIFLRIIDLKHVELVLQSQCPNVAKTAWPACPTRIAINGRLVAVHSLSLWIRNQP